MDIEDFIRSDVHSLSVCEQFQTLSSSIFTLGLQAKSILNIVQEKFNRLTLFAKLIVTLLKEIQHCVCSRGMISKQRNILDTFIDHPNEMYKYKSIFSDDIHMVEKVATYINKVPCVIFVIFSPKISLYRRVGCIMTVNVTYYADF